MGATPCRKPGRSAGGGIGYTVTAARSARCTESVLRPISRPVRPTGGAQRCVYRLRNDHPDHPLDHGSREKTMMIGDREPRVSERRRTHNPPLEWSYLPC